MKSNRKINIKYMQRRSKWNRFPEKENQSNRIE